MAAAISYFYIDDVSVVPVDPASEEVKRIQTPVIAATANEIYSLKNIQFEFNSDNLDTVVFPVLDRLVEILKQKPLWNVELTGHTDDVGEEAYNIDLSVNRAMNVRAYLQAKGIVASRITTNGVGETMLLATGTDEISRTINRRVEVQFVERQIE